MQKAIRFTVGGRNALFKMPDVNSNTYYTYNNIHKIALLGMLGAILGLSGHKNCKQFNEKEREFPEFYEKLNKISVAIVPLAPKGYFPKKVQYFNNSVGYASFETGGNLQVFEQWLENPKWDIYLKNDGVDQNLWEQLTEMLLKGECVYMPYLGKNDFPASISDPKLIELQADSFAYCHSLFIGKLSQLDNNETFDRKQPYYFTEYAPVALQPQLNFYILEQTIFTNCRINGIDNIYTDGERMLYFI